VKILRIELLKAIEEGNVRKFYKSKEWRKKRKEILLRDNKECQLCKNKRLYHKAECVHHKKHLKDFPMLALSDENLISICNPCHNVEHPEKHNNNVTDKFTNKEQW
jgi:5-methylcytosine-specific restriction endonuclease McrA